MTILVNNAGVSWQGTLDTYDREQVARMRQVNVDGVIHATRAVSRSMRAQRYGRIVNVASIAGIGTALSGNAFYAATKAEVLRSARVVGAPTQEEIHEPIGNPCDREVILAISNFSRN